MAKTQAPKVISRKHLVRAEKEHQQQLILIFSLIGFVIIVFGLIGFGLLNQYVLTPGKPVAKVDDQSITVTEFKAYAQSARISELNTYRQLSQYASIYQQFGLTLDASLQQQMSQIEYEMTVPQTFGQDVLTQMINNVIVKNEAQKLGISVSADEVTKSLEDNYGFYPNGTPTPATTPTSYIEPTLSSTQNFLLITPTPTLDLTATATLIPSPTATTQPTASLVPTFTVTPTSGPSATPVDTPTPAPTATPYTLQGFQNDLKAYITSLAVYGLTENDLRNYISTQLLDNKVFKEITKNVPTHGEQVWIRHILVATQLDAEAIVARVKNGENWIAIANQLSQDTNTNTTGGDLGWFPRGIQSTELETAAFQMNIGDIQVVQDSAGWHVVQMLGKESDRPFAQNIISQLQTKAYSAWFDPIKNAAKIDTFNIWSAYVPVAPALPTPTPAAQ